MGVSGQRHALAALYPRERPCTHCTGGWVGPRAGLDGCGKSGPPCIRSPDRPVRSQSPYQLSFPAHMRSTLAGHVFIKVQSSHVTQQCSGNRSNQFRAISFTKKKNIKVQLPENCGLDSPHKNKEHAFNEFQ